MRSLSFLDLLTVYKFIFDGPAAQAEPRLIRRPPGAKASAHPATGTRCVPEVLLERDNTRHIPYTWGDKRRITGS
jgi:hypothetical protein